MSTDPDIDPLLAELIAGEIDFDDPRVKSALRGDPERTQEWRALAAVGEDLTAEGYALRQATESQPLGLNEEALLETFRSIAGASPAGSHSAARTPTERVSARGDARSTPRWSLARRAMAASIILLGLILVIRGANKDPVDPDQSRYLGNGSDFFVTSPETPFGTARWNRSGAAAFNLEVRASSGGEPFGLPFVKKVQLSEDTWSIDPVLVPEGATELQWTLTVINADGIPAQRDIWVQQRR